MNSTIFFHTSVCSSFQIPAHLSVILPSGTTPVASAMINPTPPKARVYNVPNENHLLRHFLQNTYIGAMTTLFLFLNF